MRRGFTLVELVVVILILGIIAAVAGPRMFEATGSAKDSVLRQNLAAVRDAIELHREHTGDFPGNAGTEADFKDDLTPYLRSFPKNPIADRDTVGVETSGQPFTGTSGSHGWRYDNQSGEFIANSNGMTADGTRYWQW